MSHPPPLPAEPAAAVSHSNLPPRLTSRRPKAVIRPPARRRKRQGSALMTHYRTRLPRAWARKTSAREAITDARSVAWHCLGYRRQTSRASCPPASRRATTSTATARARRAASESAPGSPTPTERPSVERSGSSTKLGNFSTDMFDIHPYQTCPSMERAIFSTKRAPAASAKILCRIYYKPL